jgi:hypothetical protein
MMVAIKNHFHNIEKDIKESRVTRQERAVFIRAKLMLVRRDMGINQLFEMATEESAPTSVPVSSKDQPVSIPVNKSDLAAKLEQAEFFIRDLGVWDHYQKFLTEAK